MCQILSHPIRNKKYWIAHEFFHAGLSELGAAIQHTKLLLPHIFLIIENSFWDLATFTIIAEAIFDSLLRYSVAVFLKPIYDKEDLNMETKPKNTATLQTQQN